MISQAKKFDFVLVSVHLKATGLGNSDKERLEVNYEWQCFYVLSYLLYMKIYII